MTPTVISACCDPDEALTSFWAALEPDDLTTWHKSGGPSSLKVPGVSSTVSVYPNHAIPRVSVRAVTDSPIDTCRQPCTPSFVPGQLTSTNSGMSLKSSDILLPSVWRDGRESRFGYICQYETRGDTRRLPLDAVVLAFKGKYNNQLAGIPH